MKFSKQALIKLKNKNRKLKPNKYKKLKREAIRVESKELVKDLDYLYIAQMKIFMHK